MNMFKYWWQAATPAERQAMADHCEASIDTLRQEAFAYRTNGVSQLSLRRAAYIVRGSKLLARDGLPALELGDICPLWAEINELLGRA